ncbi:MAG: hypothetical protein DRN15_03475 [Thermoprotei archaeon]|nr:MAG: hypothetical protein DRN15_03475 [Thermoprotei archaeon]RLF25409.1 MAG: hypothetical protein DRM97_01935 [Thermoprotei archaeon]
MSDVEIIPGKEWIKKRYVPEATYRREEYVGERKEEEHEIRGEELQEVIKRLDEVLILLRSIDSKLSKILASGSQ